MMNGPYARFSVIRPHDGKTVDFESGYVRHLEWHRLAKDPWTWFGWTVWAGERQRWFVYASFGHSAAELDAPVDPAGDERDNIVNVTPHGAFVASALIEFLPALSQGSGEPSATTRMALTTIDVDAANVAAFEAAITEQKKHGETLWYRVIAGGPTPRYLCLKPRASLSALLEEQPPNTGKATIEILNLRPAMCYGLKS